MFYVVLLAMVAAFLALRLYSVLGKRTGHEQQPLPRAADDRATAAAPVVARPVDAAADTREPVGRNIEPQAEAGLRAIIGAEPGFDVQQFLGDRKSTRLNSSH